MPDPIVIPSIAVLTGSGMLATVNYLRKRLRSSEDRYMELYGKDEWSSCNMDLSISCKPEDYPRLREAFMTRLKEHLANGPAEQTKLFKEHATVEEKKVQFLVDEDISLNALTKPRRGMYVELDHRDEIRLVWNHIQTDGVGMWNALRPIFDPNPPLIPYRDVPAPPPLLPELLSFPKVARQMAWRGKLKRAVDTELLSRGKSMWPLQEVRKLKQRLNRPFNLVLSALIIAQIFRRHAKHQTLNVGLTAYFPFVQGRNKYGVILCKVKRGSFEYVLEQLTKQATHPLKVWGSSAAQNQALNGLPRPVFKKVVNYYRRQIDVIISSVPVGTIAVTLGDVPVLITCHPWELSVPYYFLIMGTRDDAHVSYTSRFDEEEDFWAKPDWRTIVES